MNRHLSQVWSSEAWGGDTVCAGANLPHPQRKGQANGIQETLDLCDFFGEVYGSINVDVSLVRLPRNRQAEPTTTKTTNNNKLVEEERDQHLSGQEMTSSNSSSSAADADADTEGKRVDDNRDSCE
jgi:hypothetical protein